MSPLWADSDSELAHRQHGSARRGRLQRSGVEIDALDEQVRPPRRPTEPPDLRPEATFDDRGMQIEDALPLDERQPRFVVGEGQAPDFGHDVELVQRTNDATLPFMDIDDDRRLHIRKCPPIALPCLVSMRSMDTSAT